MISDLISFFSGEFTFVEFVVSIGATVFVVFCATPLHEFAHAFIAHKLGDDTAKNLGRMTIDPKVHIDPIGAIMIFLFGFGYAKPVPVRMRKFRKPKRDMALVALAGPVCNLLQTFVLMLIYNAVLVASVKTTSETLGYIAFFFFTAAYINTNLAVFNLILVPPLDGSRILTAVLPTKIYFKIMEYERYIMIGLLILLATDVLVKPLSFISGLVMSVMQIITSLPFSFLA